MIRYLPAVLVLYLAAPVWNSWSMGLRVTVAVLLASYLALSVEGEGQRQ